MSTLSEQIKDNSLIIYNKYLIDSIFSAGILRYSCENFVEGNKEFELVELSDLNAVEDFTIYSNIIFASCIPETNINLLDELDELFNDSLIFISHDKNEYRLIKRHCKSAFIEYNDTMCSSLSLYKIAFGEFDSVIPEELKILSSSVNNKYGNYATYVEYECGFHDTFDINNFDDIYQNVLLPLCTERKTLDSLETIINKGKEILLNDKKSILRNIDALDNNVFTVDKIRTCGVIFTSASITPNFIYNENNEIENVFLKYNTLVTFNKYSKGGYEMCLYKIVDNRYENEIEEYLATNESLLTQVEDLSAEIFRLTNKFDKTKEEKDLLNARIREVSNLNLTISRNKEYISKLNKLVSFNCGKYLKIYNGFGDELFGKAIISEDKFIDILKTKTI